MSGDNGSPSSNGRNGKPEKRDNLGRFAPGHCGGPGNPHAKKLAKFRSRWLEIAKLEHVDEAYRFLHATFTDDEAPLNVRLDACEKYLNRTVGKPDQTISVGVDSGGEEMREALRLLMSDPVISERIETLKLDE